jgi:ferric-dicitrate binding protein FerR (iron transport regulator)
MKHEFENIIRCLVKGTWDELSPAEERALQEWANASEENRGVYERVVHENDVEARYALWKGLDEAAALRRVLGRAGRRRRARARRWLSAAAVVAGVAVAVVWWGTRRGEEAPVAAVAGILPGQWKAELVLEGGETRVLEGDGSDRWVAGNTDFSLRDNVLSYDTVRDAGAGYNTLLVPRGATFIVSLSDGTRVHLNAMSSVRYPVPFAADERRVFLSGQAYFEVRPDAGRPFVVETAFHEVKVLGTSFDVRAYADDGKVETTLCDGSIDVALPGGRYSLHPGEQLVFHVKEERVDVREINTDVTTSWIHDNFYFHDNTLEEIFTELRRWFYVEVEFVNTSRRDQRFSGKFSRFKNMETILDVMKRAGIGIEREGNVVRIE